MTEPVLTNSKLYAFARATPLLSSLVPDLPTLAAVETVVDNIFPREFDDGDDTRILINYHNAKGNALLYKFNDGERLDRAFDIDRFMNGLMTSLQEGVAQPEMDTPTDDVVNATVLAALYMAVSTVLGANDGPGVTDNTKTVSQLVLQSLTSIIFNDPLDVMIAFNEMPMKDNPDQTEPVVVGMWMVKQRHNITEASADVLPLVHQDEPETQH